MRTEIHLLPSPDDPPVRSVDFQAELNAFGKGLRDARVDYSQTAMAFDSADVLGFPLPEFQVLLNPAVVGPLAALVGAWLQARYGRRVRLKIGDVEAEGRSLAEVEELLKRAQDYSNNEKGRAQSD